VSDSLSHCVREARRRDRDRYLCALFAPMPARSRLIALLALDLELARIPHTVSEPLLGQMRLQWWRDAIAEARQGRPPAHPVVQALAETGAAGAFSDSGLDLLLADHDIGPLALPSVEKRGAAHAGLALDVLAVDDAPTRLAAAHIGSAWALVVAMQTGILVDAMSPVRNHLATAAQQRIVRAARPALLPRALVRAYLRRPQARLTPLGRQLRLMAAYAFG
jgi:NADH dehydrogenase [ubiquinone] 1 alpha subcomplex assembly factor 6